MDHFSITGQTNTVLNRRKSIPEHLDVLERGLKGIRAEMSRGVKVDERLVNELESRIQELRESDTNIRD